MPINHHKPKVKKQETWHLSNHIDCGISGQETCSLRLVISNQFVHQPWMTKSLANLHAASQRWAPAANLFIEILSEKTKKTESSMILNILGLLCNLAMAHPMISTPLSLKTYAGLWQRPRGTQCVHLNLTLSNTTHLGTGCLKIRWLILQIASPSLHFRSPKPFILTRSQQYPSEAINPGINWGCGFAYPGLLA